MRKRSFEVCLMMWLILIPSRGISCTCKVPMNGCAGLVAESEEVFLGRVLSTKLINAKTYSAILEVIKVWKGTSQKEITVMTSNIGSMCGVDFFPGRTYLVFSREGKTNFCLGTNVAELAEKELKFLGEPIWENPSLRDWGISGRK